MSDPGFFQYLRSDAQVAALCAQRIYPTRAPQGDVRPMIVWLRTGIERQQLYCGASELVKAEYQFACYANNATQAQAVHAAVRAAMQDYRGPMGAVDVRHCHLTNDFVSEDDDPSVHRVLQLWSVWYVET